jgi:hypothetical protein
MQFDLFGSPDKFLAKLRSDWRETIEHDGGHCPCCGKWGKISPQGMNETRALALLWLSRAPTNAEGWVDVPNVGPRWLLRGKTHTTLQHWGFVEPGSHDDSTKRADGLWRITDKGKQFIAGTVTVPKKAYIYNNAVEGWSDECVSFRDCFGRHFDYQEVMADTFNLNAIKI